MPSEINAPPQANTQSSTLAICAMHRSKPLHESLAYPLNLMRRRKRLHRAHHVLCSMHRPKALRDGAQRTF